MKYINLFGGGKTPKISRSILILDKKQGGLRLVSLKDKQKSLKIQWFSQINAEPDSIWAQIFYSFVNKDLGSTLWKCNLAPIHADIIFNDKADVFWKQMFRAWCEFNYRSEINSDNIADQLIWLNSHILIDKKPFIFVEAFKVGLVFIRDLFKADGNFKNIEEINQQFGNSINWFQYLQLQKAIPLDIKTALCLNNFSMCNYDKLHNMGKIS